MWRAFLAVATVLFVAGFWFAFRAGQASADNENYFVVQMPLNELGEVPLGDASVTVTVKNNSEQDRRILGISTACNQTCCYGEAEGRCVITVKSGQCYDLVLQVKVAAPGPFEAPLQFYLEDRTTRLVKIPVTGTGRGQ